MKVFLLESVPKYHPGQSCVRSKDSKSVVSLPKRISGLILVLTAALLLIDGGSAQAARSCSSANGKKPVEAQVKPGEPKANESCTADKKAPVCRKASGKKTQGCRKAHRRRKAAVKKASLFAKAGSRSKAGKTRACAMADDSGSRRQTKTCKKGMPIASRLPGNTFALTSLYFASGFMGDTGDLKVTPDAAGNQFTIHYKPSGSNGWAGLYWQYPKDNWGDKGNGLNMQGATSLTFSAKGSGTISAFMVGGVPAQNGVGDSSETSLKNVVLTGEWKQYTIDLTGKDLSNIIDGFGFTASKAANAKFTMEVKDIMVNFANKK